MIVKFHKIVLEGFMSFGSAEVVLDNPGYTLVAGVNKNPADAALSNGSGKSSIFNGLSWCLTGETLNGLKNDDVVNIHTDTGCKVELTFSIDEVEYKVTRYRKYPKLGNNLKIEVNGQDRSGATLSKSEEILESLVPDLTPDLIGSVILLGQGLPHKFSNNSPAGRKELLENLSKSNYMIQDIKNRLAKRDSKLADLMREQEDLELTTNTKLSMLATQKQKAIDSLAALENHPDFDTTISQLTKQITDKNTELSAISAKITDLVSQASDLKSKITEILEQNNIKQTNITQSHNDYQTDIRTRMTEAFTKSNALAAEITKLKSIKDVCPTCGQKIPGVIKQDTSKQEAEKAELDKLYNDLKEESRLDNENYNKVIAELKQKAADETRELNLAYNKVNTELGLAQGKQSTIGTEIRTLEIQKTNITNQRDNYLKDKQAFEKTIKDCDSETVTLNESLTYINSKKVDLQDHINVISKMKTLVQRDFRGILLSNVIDFVDMKLKEYCSVVFDTDNVGFKLNGTNIEITFCDKSFEALSGGEKQRVDICLQFAIRDFMSQYLGFSSNILSIDEVFDQLDANACARVLNLISTKLTDVESIYIISHHRDLDIPQDFEITVEKDENGISRIR